jgi:hypothetical protein
VRQEGPQSEEFFFVAGLLGDLGEVMIVNRRCRQWFLVLLKGCGARLSPPPVKGGAVTMNCLLVSFG